MDSNIIISGTSFLLPKNQVNMIRIPQINTKQNLLLINHKLLNFRNLISNNKKIQDAVFFKN